MITAEARAGRRRLDRARVVELAAPVLFGVLPVLVIAMLFVTAAGDDAVAYDFRVFYDASRDVLHGVSPYPAQDEPLAGVGRAYVYPPPTAFAVAPFTVLPAAVAGLLAMAVLVVAALAVLWLLGVSDWRCYGLVMLWPPVISAVQTGSLSILLALGVALTWRLRDRKIVAAGLTGALLAAKFFLWPLVVWLFATRRIASAIVGSAVAAALVLGSWAVIGFSGFVDYPSLLRRLDTAVGEDAYTAYVVGQDLGLPSPVARAVWLVLGLALLAAIAIVVRRGDERSAMILAIAAALALTPIVWLHYFALLVVVVALAQRSLSALWFVPLAMVVTPGSGHPAPWQTAWTLTIAAVTMGWALRLVRCAER